MQPNDARSEQIIDDLKSIIAGLNEDLTHDIAADVLRAWAQSDA
jgi:hypothetical protein